MGWSVSWRNQVLTSPALGNTKDIPLSILSCNNRLPTDKYQLSKAGNIVDSLTIKSAILDFANYTTKTAPGPECAYFRYCFSAIRVWIFGFDQFQQWVSGFMDSDLSKNFRKFMGTSYVLRLSSSKAHCGYNLTEIATLRDVCGSRVLQHLERALSSKVLAQASFEGLQSLLCVLVGTIIGVCVPVRGSSEDQVYQSYTGRLGNGC